MSRFVFQPSENATPEAKNVSRNMGLQAIVRAEDRDVQAILDEVQIQNNASKDVLALANKLGTVLKSLDWASESMSLVLKAVYYRTNRVAGYQSIINQAKEVVDYTLPKTDIEPVEVIVNDCNYVGEENCTDQGEQKCFDFGEQGCAYLGEENCGNVGEGSCILPGETGCIYIGEGEHCNYTGQEDCVYSGEAKCKMAGQKDCKYVGESGCVYPAENGCQLVGEQGCIYLGEEE